MNDAIAPTRPDHERLFDVASEQSGYFTAAQAGECGFSKPLLAHHARAGGRFIRVRHGLYRLREYPSSPREDVIAAWLTADRNVAVVSHESALDLLDLSDVVPDAVHLTVPRSKRYRRGTPGIAVHTTTRSLRPRDVVVRDGIRVTSAERSIMDAAEGGMGPDQIARSVTQALERGMTTESRLLAAARDRSRRVERLVRMALQRRSGT
jgi:predicted transcriptional regulator of viral defense system